MYFLFVWGVYRCNRLGYVYVSFGLAINILKNGTVFTYFSNQLVLSHFQNPKIIIFFFFITRKNNKRYLIKMIMNKKRKLWTMIKVIVFYICLYLFFLINLATTFIYLLIYFLLKVKYLLFLILILFYRKLIKYMFISISL